MIVFVNGRPVDSRTLNYALIESYHESLPKGRYPLAFVFFECDPAAVDVNVHPAKREVRFRSEAQVRSFVIRGVLAALRAAAPPVAGMAVVEIPPVSAPAAVSHLPTPSVGVARPLSSGARSATGPASVSWIGPAVARPPAPAPASAPLAAAPSSAAVRPAASIASWRFLGLAHTNYALFETPAGLLLLDRRAAQERIVFEELTGQFAGGDVLVQRLLLPVVLELDPVGAALLRDRLGFLAKHGFEIAEFGRATFRLEGVPAVLDPADGEACLRDLLDAFRDGRSAERDPEVAREQLARLAAARAVRLASQVDGAEMRALVARLFACRAPHTSPGGRPTQVELSQGEIARRFGRT
jgi:DNA mismatch repair protein MutL